MSLALLRLVLLARCVVGFVFAWRLHGAAPTTFPAVLEAFEPFAVIDGVLALALAPLVLAERWGAGVGAVAVLDGLVRLAAAAMIARWPGIPYFPVTVVVFSCLLAALGALVGLFQIGMAVQLRRRSGSTLTGIALAVMGGVLVVLAVVSFRLDPSPAAAVKLLESKALLQTLAFAFIMVAARPGRSWVATHAYRSSQLR